MIDATVCTYSNGESGIVVWKDRDHPTKEELCPPNAEKHSHVIIPHDWLAFVQKWPKDQVHNILLSLLPRSKT